MRRSDIVLVYFDPTDGLRHCRICSSGRSNTICYNCVKQSDKNYKCCSHSNLDGGQWSEHFKFDNSIHTILVSVNICNLIPNCKKKNGCDFFGKLQKMCKNMENIVEK